MANCGRAFTRHRVYCGCAGEKRSLGAEFNNLDPMRIMKVQSDPSDEEYEVYSIALTKLHPFKEAELIVFRERTRSVRLAQLTDEDVKAEPKMGDNPTKIMSLEFPEAE